MFTFPDIKITPTARRNFFVSACVLSSCVLFGCTEQKTEGSATVFVWSPWVGPSVIVGGLVLAGLGAVLKNGRMKLGLIVLGVGAAVAAGPMMMQENVIVDKQHFSMKTGFWFAPNEHSVKFSDLKKIEIVTRHSRRHDSTDLACFYKHGAREVVPVSNLMEQGGAEKLILENARAAGVAVQDNSE